MKLDLSEEGREFFSSLDQPMRLEGERSEQRGGRRDTSPCPECRTKRVVNRLTETCYGDACQVKWLP